MNITIEISIKNNPRDAIFKKFAFLFYEICSKSKFHKGENVSHSHIFVQMNPLSRNFQQSSPIKLKAGRIENGHRE